MKPLYSIIIPTFNSEGTLHECLRSLIAQTFTSFEILIVDGVSSDRTIDIAKSFNDKRIRINCEKDTGIYDAMNKGIDMAKGEWLYFFGSDDKLYSSSILDVVSKELENFDFVYGNVISNRFNGIYDGEFDDLKILSKNLCHQSIFFKRRIFDRTGKFNLRYKAHADWDHNLKWFLSPFFKKKFINLIIADYADNGFSSKNEDPLFFSIKKWKYSLLIKDRIKLNDKFRVIRIEIKNALKENRINDIFQITIQIPYFLL